ncbi:glycoside hydrolase family 3 N-terminal domain-containing protein [Actinomyces respiraculi]|uniref:glycoside hydrolase family 3 N-terminal domain-containing protein n=1 Tax=Actinomyces respiraculi TaxID=2744574 RepID=UPI00141EDDBC|nr:glycoside hydrolase family 3 N-terminal domain-containing protein [Actinomyces respiraculi]
MTQRPLPRRTVLAGTLTGTLAVGALAACATTPSGPETGSAAQSMPTSSPRSTAPSSRQPTPSATSSPEPTTSPPASPIEGWSLEELVGQLLIVGVPAAVASPEHAEIVAQVHAGGVFLHGRSTEGTQATRAVVASYTDLAHRAGLLVATDQEGGAVQVLSGPGLSTIPAAEDQALLDPEVLTAHAAGWGTELAAAGVTMNLAPCADLVDTLAPSDNAPIGAWGRQYGTDTDTATAGALAFNEGMRSAGVEPVVKHFPGLGRVTENTDIAAGVVDSTTVRDGDPAVGVFAAAVRAGARAVMLSSATYLLIDAGAPACFSPVVVTDMLRGDLGFTGVVMTDDVSAAAQVQAWSPGERAVLAVRAGVDVVLASANARVALEMAQALVAEARADADVAARVEQAALRVLALKGVPGA